MEISELCDGLQLDEQGVWRTGISDSVAYPRGGNKCCFGLEDSSFWFKHRNECILAALERFPTSGTVVDVGGGNGFVTRALLEIGTDAVLLEPGPEGALNGRFHRRIPKVICSTFEQAGFKDDTIPSVGLFDVLEHVDNDRAFLQIIERALRPDGLLFLTVPANPRLWSAADYQAQHFRRYSERSLTAAVANSFEILYFTFIFRILALPILALRVLPSRTGLYKEGKFLGFGAEHKAGSATLARLVSFLLRSEVKRIRRGQQISSGTGCLLVARKRDN